MTRCITGQDLLSSTLGIEKQILLGSNTEWHFIVLSKEAKSIKNGINCSQLMVLIFRDICKNTKEFLIKS